MRIEKIIIKAIFLAFKDLDFKSAFKLLNLNKDLEFISKMDLIK